MRSRHGHNPWLQDETIAPDDTLLPPGVTMHGNMNLVQTLLCGLVVRCPLSNG